MDVANLQQSDLNHVLFENISKAGLVNMTRAREPDVVEQMLHLRDRGEHPSLISTTSVLRPGHFAQPQQQQQHRSPQQSPPYQYHAQAASPAAASPGPATPPRETPRETPQYQLQQPLPQFRLTPRDSPKRVTPPAHSPTPVYAQPPMRMTYNLTPSAFEMPPSAATPPPRAPSPASSYGQAAHAPIPAPSYISQPHRPFAPTPSGPSRFAAMTQQHMQQLATPAVTSAAMYGAASALPPLPPARRSSKLSAVESSVTHQGHHRRRRHERAARSRSRSSSTRRSSRDRRRRKGGRAYRYELTTALKDLNIAFNEEEDSTSDLEFILDRTLSRREKQKKVDSARKGVGIGTFVIEQILVKLLPSFNLSGWSSSVMEELSSDTHSDTLEQAYRKAFKGSGPSNVWFSLAVIIVTTAIAQRSKNNEGGTGAGGRPRTSGGGFNPMDLLGSFMKLGGSGGGNNKARPAANAVAVAPPVATSAAAAAAAQTAAASRRRRMAPAEI